MRILDQRSLQSPDPKKSKTELIDSSSLAWRYAALLSEEINLTRRGGMNLDGYAIEPDIRYTYLNFIGMLEFPGSLSFTKFNHVEASTGVTLISSDK